MYTCRECERPINQASELCPYCGADLTAPPAEAAAPKKKPSIWAAVLRWGFLLAAMWLFLWFVLPERPTGQVEFAERRAVEALGEVQRALAAYADARDGEFPPSLETLGDRARLPAQRAQREGYVLHYAPAPAGPDGRTERYTLEARASFHGYRNFFTDHTGVLRATREPRPATDRDPPVE